MGEAFKALNWPRLNDIVSTVILGASKASQLTDKLGALALTPKLMPEVMVRIDAISRAHAA
ncbi:hypothetical protein [Paucibacter sp. KCTC 42545]|uniref:hypothetical protein n=1 Tax=Paucibacter sp. KCTC 42545 TaxID=1768242 RepID=UPI000733AFD6|nr:hypothetical protein [Paucibacter sp. KCTC 42545]ALT78552.1 hypothetical protein AT984_16500 [Paucibacter sp. KCTC 42545]